MKGILRVSPAFFRLTIVLLVLFNACSTPYPKGFAPIATTIPNLQFELLYATANNFTGRPVRGYTNIAKVLSRPALNALAAAQKDFNAMGMGLKLYDGYRPQKAVDEFVAWSKRLNDTLRKQQYYPKVPKSELFIRGYIAAKSGHSRGSTVDVGLVYLEGPKKGEEVDMGSPWDFFGPISWATDTTITVAQQNNRKLLAKILMQHGFKPYTKEWWHFTLKEEPFPDTYFDF
jgi:D-alanyl-D-alanine dipeptidase